MKKLLLLAVSIYFLPVFPVSAQESSFCDTETGDSFIQQVEQLLYENRHARKLGANEQIDVPITFHVEKQNGKAVISNSEISSALNTINSWYANGDISFSTCGNTRFYTEGKEKKINDRTVNVIVYKNKAGCGATARYIYINVNCIRTFQLILAHELGHVLGLPHTHGLGNTGTTNELVNGSNCDIAGDRFCDTPADPNLLNKVDQKTCTYTGNAKDANGQVYQPDVSNIMSYSMDACMNYFSNQQFAKMREVAQARGYVCCLTPKPTVANKSICGGETTTLTATGQGTIKWYDAAEGGSLLAIGSSYSTNTLSSTTAFYAEAIDGCASARVEALVKVNPPSGVITTLAENFVEINPDPAKGSWPRNLLVNNNLLYFVASEKLHVTNGQSSNVTQLYEGNIARIFAYKDGVIATSNHDSKGPVLVYSEGTSATTTEVKAFGGTYGYSNFEAVVKGNTFYFIVNGPGEKAELWQWNGTNAPEKLSSLNKSPFDLFKLTVAGEHIYLVDKDSNGDEELYIAKDGGVSRLKDINPAASSSPDYLVNSNGNLYFLADDGTHGRELWVSDGTVAGTFMLVDVNTGGDAKADVLTSLNGSLYFAAQSTDMGFEPFKTDGTAEGTRPLGDLNPKGDSKVYKFLELNGEVYLVADDGVKGSELWKEDLLSPRGATLVKDINPSGGSAISYANVVDGILYFSANDGNFNNELWRTDGTESGTFQLAEINSSGSSFPQEFSGYNNTLFFTASNSTNNREIWYLNEQELSICSGNSITIKTGNPAGNIAWYDLSTGGTKLSSQAHFTTPVLHRNSNFYVSLTAGGCTTERKLIRVKVTAPLPEVENDTIFENEATSVKAKVTSGTIEWFKSKSDAAPFHTGTSYTTPKLQKDVVYYLRTKENECVSTWQELKVIVVPSYQLTVEKGMGTGEYAENDKVVVNANNPPAGHVFDQWQGDVQYVEDVKMPATKVTMPDKDISIIAAYRTTSKPTYQLIVNQGKGSGIYEAGTSVKIYADEPEDEVMKFKAWEGDVIHLEDPSLPVATLTMPVKKTEITAIYDFDIDVTPVEDAVIPVFSLYPNPVRGGFLGINIEQARGSYQLFDATGNSVSMGELSYGENNVNVASFDSGMYFIKITIDKNSFQRKIILY